MLQKVTILKTRLLSTFKKKISNFKWTNTKELTEIDFTDYIRLSIANHYDKWY